MRLASPPPPRSATAVLLLGVAAFASASLACAFAPGGNTGSTLTTSNAIWNCPTITPIPPPTPIPITCATGTPDANGTPGPEECGRPIPTWTPLPSPTPYGRWFSPGDRGTTTTFYEGQDVRVGALKVTLTGYSRSAPLPDGQVAHIFTFDTRNEGTASLDVQWPLQTFLREIAVSDTVQTGTWWEGNRAEDAAGIPHWDPSMGTYGPGEHKSITVAIAGPAGQAHAIGFAPDPVGGQSRPDLGQAAHILWFVPQGDPRCEGNTSGPPRQGDGGAVYPKPLPGTPTSQFGYFQGWPIAPNGQAVLTQAFGCTAFHEISGFDCPNDRPWFHSGVDLADPGRPLVLSVLHGRVVYVGPSAGRACSFPGSEPPHTNLGWMVELVVLDDTGHVGPYHVKYGHTQVGSEQVQVGDEVWPGQILARMASTGCSTGPHLHFMVQDEVGRFLDPFNFIGSAPRR